MFLPYKFPKTLPQNKAQELRKSVTEMLQWSILFILLKIWCFENVFSVFILINSHLSQPVTMPYL